MRRLGESWGGGNGRALTVLPFKAGILGPQIAVARVTSSGRTSQLRNVPARNAEIILASGGNPRIAWSRRAYTLRATSRFVNSASFAVVVGSLVVYSIVTFGDKTMVGLGDCDLDKIAST